MEEAVLRGRREGSEDEEGRADGEGDDGLEEDAVDDDKDAPRLFLLLSRLPEPHRAFLLTQSPLLFLSTDLLLAHAQTHLNRLLTARNLIDFLPFEILSIIGRLAHQGARYHKIHVGSRLIAVSRRWRAIFGEDETFWEEVSLTEGSASLARLEAFGLRSPVRVLRIFDCGTDTKSILQALKGKLSSLEKLDVCVDANGTLEDLWDAFLPSVPNLHTLRLENADPAMKSIAPLPHRHLLPNLVHLTVSEFRPAENRSLYPLLKNVRKQLWSLELAGACSLSLAPIRRTPATTPFVVRLPNLTTLDIGLESDLLDDTSSTFLIPNLQILNLCWASLDYHLLLFPPDHYPSNTTHLSTLLIHGENVRNEAILIQDLRRMPLLKSLELAYDDHSSDATLEALTIEEGVEPCAPLLSELAIQSNDQFTGEALVRMVKSREGLGRMGGGKGKVSVDGCDGVDEDSMR